MIFIYMIISLFGFLTTARHETCLCSFDEFKFVKDVG